MPDLESITVEAHRHEYADGIREVWVGLLLAVGALGVGGRYIGALVPLAALVLAASLPKVRDRFTTPRAGYAELPFSGTRLLGGITVYVTAAAVLVIVVMALAGDLATPARRYRWIPALVGVALAGGFIHAASVSRFRRFRVYAWASVLAGMSLTLTATGGRAEAYSRLAELLGGLSVLLVVTGAAIFIGFLRRHRVHAGDPGKVTDGR